MKVLVVEDSERLSRSLTIGLSKAGFAVDAAQDGRDGLAMAQTYDYDAVVLDLMLPGMPGIEILRRLRQAGSTAHVLILSARDQVEDRIAGLDADGIVRICLVRAEAADELTDTADSHPHGGVDPAAAS